MSQSGTRKMIRFYAYICFPEKIKRCCWGGIPSFSSTRSLIRSTLSVGSISISISFPVRVYKNINRVEDLDVHL